MENQPKTAKQLKQKYQKKFGKIKLKDYLKDDDPNRIVLQLNDKEITIKQLQDNIDKELSKW